MGIDYKKSGVDIDAGDALVDWLKESQKADSSAKRNSHTNNLGHVVDGIGGFAALFKPNFSNYKKPLLVSSTDGVGTKVKLASRYKKFQGVGQDLVAMCANDLITCGAKPLFFLDYYAVGKLDVAEAKEFLTGVRESCARIGCALIGGETAEMPGVYQIGDFDCAGFIVGVVDEDHQYGPHRVQPDDIVVGFSSSGFHSNGYSLIRKVFEKDLDDWAEDLLTPTHLYGALADDLVDGDLVHAMANITGGGVHNIPRAVPEGMGVELEFWELPLLFQEVQRRTGMSRDQMLKTLNCGIGYVSVGPQKHFGKIQSLAAKYGYAAREIGRLVPVKGPSKVVNVEE